MWKKNPQQLQSLLLGTKDFVFHADLSKLQLKA